MALTTTNQASTAFKRLFGAAQTAPPSIKGLINEGEPSNIILSAGQIYLDKIDSNPTNAINDGVAEFISGATFTADSTSNGHAFFLEYPASHSNTGRIENSIPPSYGSSYTIKIFDSNDNQIPLTDPRDWIFDYSSGILFQQTANASPTPAKANIYKYKGDYVSDVISSSGLSTNFQTGSIGFADSNGLLIEDNSNLYYDNNNNRLGVGTNSPAAKLHVDGEALFDNSVTINGNLTVSGTTYQANVEQVNIEDNLGFINFGETASGVQAGYAGWEVDRGSLVPFRWVFEETDDLFKVGQYYTELTVSGATGNFNINDGLTGQTSNATAFVADFSSNVITLKGITGTFQNGETVDGDNGSATITGVDTINQLQAVATRETVPNDGGVAFWDSANSRFETENIFYWNKTKNQLGIDQASPDATLDINGNFNIELGHNNGINSDIFSINNKDSSDGIKFYGGSSSNDPYMKANGGSPLIIGADDSNHMYINTSGNIGVYTTNPSAKFDITGDLAYDALLTSYQTISSNYNITSDTDYTLFADTSSNTVTVTLPDATANAGRLYNVKKVDNTTNKLELVDSASNDIDRFGQTYSTDSDLNPSLKVQSDGNQWWFI